MSSVELKLDGLLGLEKGLPAFLDKITKKIAKETPKQIINGIRLRKQGINLLKELPDNEESTKIRKNKDTPMIDKGVLTNKSKWSVESVTGGYIISPPADRVEGLLAWHEGQEVPGYGMKYYRVMDVPDNYFPEWARKIANDEFKKFIGKHS